LVLITASGRPRRELYENYSWLLLLIHVPVSECSDDVWPIQEVYVEAIAICPSYFWPEQEYRFSSHKHWLVLHLGL
jgi:hypothetical protein